tara:strand:+ start:17080 stop:17907 length:828 start_codon:yes stop_codon:yes gene_type:complete
MIHPYTHLEDFSEDIISKAQNGLRMTNRNLADQAGIDLAQVKSLKAGAVEPEALQSIANVLQLDGARLLVSARKSWLPAPQAIQGLSQFVSEFHSMTVNAYLLEAPTGEAILFDTGVDPAPILAHLHEKQLNLSAIFLTHGHPDHVAVLEPILQQAGPCPVYAHPTESIPNTEPFEWDQPLTAGPFHLQTISTPGHTPGGTSFLLKNLPSPLAVVGDALFAGSVGGCAADYSRALDSIRNNLLTLPSETVLCPGHGPLTTTGEENLHNPFFPKTE